MSKHVSRTRRQRFKIVHLITRMDMGGSAQNTIQTCLGTCDRYEVVLIHGPALESAMTDRERSSVDRQIAQARELGVTVICLPAFIRKVSPLQDLRALFSIFKILLHEKPHIVHTHTSKAGILGRLAAKLARVPIIINTMHGHVFYGHFSPFASKVFLRLEQLFSSFTDRQVALTQGERKDYLSYRLCKAGKIALIHSGVEVDRFINPQVDIAAGRKQLGLAQRAPVVGTIGWLLPIKGPMFLLKAMAVVWKTHPDAQLVYVGKGDLEEDLRAEAGRLGAKDKVKFLGWREDIHNILPCFDLFVLPSMNEGMGRVIVEAMAAAKPVVATEVGGIPDLVIPGENGLLVKPADEQTLAAAINKILSDPDLAVDMGKKGLARCRDFSLQAMIEKLNDLYEEVLAAKGLTDSQKGN